MNVSESGVQKEFIFCLVVDDEPLAQNVLETYIGRMAQLEIVGKCDSVNQALSLLKTKSVDIIFLDLNLKTTNGSELINEIRQFPGNRYYIIITSAVLPKNTSLWGTKNAIIVDGLTKPISYESFKTAVQKAINQMTRS